MKLRVVDGGGETPPPADTGMADRLEAMVKECLQSNPSVVMLVWEAQSGSGLSELRTLVTPPSQAIIRGLVELLHEQIHSDEL